MSIFQSAMSRQEFMKGLEAQFSKKNKVVRLPFAYTSMESACITQVQQIWAIGKSKMNPSITATPELAV